MPVQILGGNQVAAGCPSVVVSRLTGASLVAAGSCADCADGTYAAGDTDTCLAHTTCGFQVDGTTTRLKDGIVIHRLFYRQRSNQLVL